MGQSTDQIRQEIDQKRDDAAGKIDQLQTQVVDTADTMRSTVQDTAGQMRDQVKGTVEDTVETVRQNMDFRQQIEERPLMALGVALVGGFVLGGLTGGGGGHHSSGGSHFTQSYQPPTTGQYNPPQSSSGSTIGAGIRSALQKTGIEDTISNAAAAMLGSMTDQLKETLDRNFPGFADKMQTAQEKPGGFADKARETQSTTTTA
jgi:ElaB/YqjD/DUF883 family membrane-anchored ribosome-binding protein